MKYLCKLWTQTPDRFSLNPSNAGTTHLVRFVAAYEIVGSVGVILPVWLSIAPFLTAWAALGLALVMIGAAFTDYWIHELRPIAINLVIR